MERFFLAILLCLLASICEPTCDDILITDFSQDNCIAMQTTRDTFYYWIDKMKSCIPQCVAYEEKGYLRKKCPCVPGYVCGKRCSGTTDAYLVECETNADCKAFPRSRCIETCVADARTCMAYYANTTDYRTNKFTAQKFKPACQNDGFWKAKQCKGGVSGRCLCFDSIGNRLFGEARHSQAADMTCACSRRKAELLAAGRDYVSFHCNSMGNYEELQCDSGLCWCAEEKTGEPISPLVPEKAMVKLPCYVATKVGAQYLRQCDSVTYANAKIAKILKQHGVTHVNMGVKLCDGDGAFGAFNISQGIAYCTWRDGTKIGTFQGDSSTDIGSLNCNCARDYKRYNHGLTCLGNGNYQPYQSYIENMKNYYYCIDDDGFQKTEIIGQRLDNCTLYY